MAMANNKTKETSASVDTFLGKVKPQVKQKDCATLRDMMARVSGESARMWGTSIVGFGVRRYKYESGREGEICKLGFSPRAQAISLYGVAGEKDAAAVAELGKATTGKGCLYIKSLADVDLKKLEALMRRAYQEA